jgi:hypothetical protein
VISEIQSGMIGSEWTSHVLGRPVIKAFNNIVANSLLYKGLPKGSTRRIALPVSGDDLKSKQLVMALLDQMVSTPSTPVRYPNPGATNLEHLPTAPIQRSNGFQNCCNGPNETRRQEIEIRRRRSWRNCQLTFRRRNLYESRGCRLVWMH